MVVAVPEFAAQFGKMGRTKPPVEATVIRSLEASDVGQSFRLASLVFAESSTLHRALNVELDAYRAYLWPSFYAMASEGLSVVAVHPARGEIIGCLVVTAFLPEATPEPETPGRFAPLATLTSDLVARYSSKRKLRHGEAVLVDMGAVASAATGLGIYSAMREHAAFIARARGFRFILGELSSAATQHFVLNRLGHRPMAEVAFANFECAGAYPFSSIKHPPKIILSEGDLT